MERIQQIRDVEIGEGVEIFHFVNLYGCSIGANTKIGSFVEIQKNVKVGQNCKIQSHTFICEGVTIQDDVFIGHGVMFTNDKYPRAVTQTGKMASEGDWELLETVVEKGAVIGSGATILPGIRIGAGALVGAGAVVTRDVEPYTKVAGNPAKAIGKVSV